MLNLQQGEYWIVRNDEQKQGAIRALSQVAANDAVPIAVKIEPYKPKRSALQNRFLWGWIYKSIANQLEQAGIVIHCNDGKEHPYTKDVLHEIFKVKFLTKACIESKSKSLTLYYSTTELSTKKFSEFVEQVRNFCSQFWSIQISDPINGEYRAILNELQSRK